MLYGNPPIFGAVWNLNYAASLWWFSFIVVVMPPRHWEWVIFFNPRYQFKATFEIFKHNKYAVFQKNRHIQFSIAMPNYETQHLKNETMQVWITVLKVNIRSSFSSKIPSEHEADLEKNLK